MNQTMRKMRVRSAAIAVLLGVVACAGKAPDEVPDAGLGQTSGSYRCPTCTEAQPWHIDANRMLWWKGQPYVPYMAAYPWDFLTYPVWEGDELAEALAGIDRQLSAGIREFFITVEHNTFVNSLYDSPAFHDRVTDHIASKDGTYSVFLNGTQALLSDAVQQGLRSADRAPFFIRAVADVSGHAGKTEAPAPVTVSFARSRLDLTRFTSVAVGNRDHIENTGVTFEGEVRAYLVDLVRESVADVSSAVAGTSYDDAAAAVQVRFSPIAFPAGGDLRMVVLPRVYATVTKSVGDAVPLVHRPAIVEGHRWLLDRYRAQVAKEGLRTVALYNEIDGLERAYHFTDRDEFAADVQFPDFSSQSELTAYRAWLLRRHQDLQGVNAHFGTSYASIDEVSWNEPIVFDQSHLLGIFTSRDQLGRFDEAQRAFFVHRVGEGFAALQKLVKDVWGEVPACVSSAHGYWLGIQEASLQAGVDGLCAHYYGSVHGEKWTGQDWDMTTRADLGLATEALQRAEAADGRARFYWVTELNHALPESAGEGFRYQPFQTSQDMGYFVDILRGTGVKGFLYFTATDLRPPLRPELLDWYATRKQATVAAASGRAMGAHP